MRTLLNLTESDFEMETAGALVPILDFGDESEYYITYGHIPFDEMEQYARLFIAESGGDPSDTDYWGSLDDTTWGYAVAIESFDEDRGYSLKWNNITSDTEGAFPVTILSVW